MKNYWLNKKQFCEAVEKIRKDIKEMCPEISLTVGHIPIPGAVAEERNFVGIWWEIDRIREWLGTVSRQFNGRFFVYEIDHDLKEAVAAGKHKGNIFNFNLVEAHISIYDIVSETAVNAWIAKKISLGEWVD